MATVPFMKADVSRLNSILERWTRDLILPGASLLVQQDREILLEHASGLRDIERNIAVDTNNIWVVASLAKPVAAAALIQVVESGRVSLDQKVKDLLPEFYHDRVLVRHLLTHTSGLGPMEPEDEAILRYGRVRAIADQGLLFEPGSKCSYTTPAFDLVEEIVCQESGLTWVEYTRRQVFEPLGMNSTSYQPPAEWSDRIPVVYDPENRIDPWWNARFLRAIGLAGGGLFSTLRDLAALAQSFLDHGKPILSAESCRQMITLQTSGLLNLEGHPQTWGFGWYLNQDQGTGFGALSMRAFGHGGVTGTWLCVDPDRELIVVKLGNRLGITLEDGSRMQSTLLNEILQK